MVNVSTLVDQLIGTTLYSGNWNTPVTSTNTSVTPTAGGLVMANAIGTTTAQAATVNSVNTAFTFDSFSFELTNVTAPANSGFFVSAFDTANISIKVAFVLDSGNLIAQVNGVNQSTVPFSAINHKWLKVSTTGANVIFQTAQDGATWNTFFTYTTSNPLSGLGCFLQIGTYTDATLTAASSFTVSNLNFGPLSPPVANDWLAGYDIQPAVGTNPGDLDVYASQAFNFLAQPPFVRAIQTAVQSLPASWTVVTLDTTVEANNATFSGNTFTCAQPGWYSVTGRVTTSPVVNSQVSIGLQFVIAGNTIGPLVLGDSVATIQPWAMECDTDIYLNAGDTIQLYFLNGNATAISTLVTTGATNDQSSLEVVWICE